MFDELHAAGQTIIVVTHEEYIAERARRTVRLRDGIIESDVPSGSARRGDDVPRGTSDGSAAEALRAAEVLAG
jgi:putative ABC transport system ATP-binding protein